MFFLSVISRYGVSVVGMTVGTRGGDYPWWLFFGAIHRSGLVLHEILVCTSTEGISMEFLSFS